LGYTYSAAVAVSNLYTIFVAILLLLEFLLIRRLRGSFSSLTAASSIRILGLPSAPPSYVINFAF
jgi:hypothetical protein